MQRFCLLGLLILGIAGRAAIADDPVFSGPQAGEKLPPLKIKAVFGDRAGPEKGPDNGQEKADGREVDLIGRAGGKPILLAFVHTRTRPAFGLTRTLMEFAASRSESGLQAGVVFLTDDPTEMTDWMRRVRMYLPEGALYGVSVDGVEGPGAYGLNHNVTLTVLVGNQGKVTSNFALVQPSLQADAPKILQAVVDVTGGGKVPTLDELGVSRQYARRSPAGRAPAADMRDQPLGRLLRSVINKQASEQQVAEAVEAVEKLVREDESARTQLGQIAARIVQADKLANYGTPAAQAAIRQWAKTYGERTPAKAPEPRAPDAPRSPDTPRAPNPPRAPEAPGASKAPGAAESAPSTGTAR